MTVLTMPAQPGQDTDAALRPLPWRRLAWVSWRLHRATLISVAAVLAAVAVFLVVAGLKIHHDYAALVACKASCQALNSNFNNSDWTAGNTVAILMTLAPALLGAFVGAPLLARELETGSYRYAWTQGFGRERSTLARLAGAAATITVLAWAFSQVFDWFFEPFLPQEDMTVLTRTVFATHGIAFAAWTLLAVSIGACAGMLVRRIIPAMAITLGAYLVLALAAWEVFKYYPVAAVSSNPNIGGGPATMNSPWILGFWFTGPGGQPVSEAMASKLNALPYAKFPAGYTMWTRYIPVSKFWPLQFIEGGWLLVLSLLLIAATVLLVRRRAA
jgi:hypothetical protein